MDVNENDLKKYNPLSKENLSLDDSKFNKFISLLKRVKGHYLFLVMASKFQTENLCHEIVNKLNIPYA